MIKTVPSVRKILQALYYIQSRAPSDNPSRYNKVFLLKMIYAADRYHLRHFGYFATDDRYYAMKLGPVAETTYNVLKKSPYNVNSAELGYFAAVKELSENDVFIEQQDEDELSASFTESLDFALKEFGGYSWGTFSDFSHCYPEWKRHEAQLQANTFGRVPMDANDFFDDPEDVACLKRFNKDEDPFAEEDKEFLMLLKEGIDADTIPA